MTDIADINIRVKTSDMKKAVGEFENFKQSAKQAAAAADQFSTKASKRGATSANSATTATREARKESAELRRRRAEVELETAAIKKQNAELRLQKTLKASARGEARKFDKLATGIDTRTGQMARDLGVNRFNTANIAAQFQDIGVTAAMGMNPMTIALQQGTQLSAILNNMGNPLKGLAQAFTQLINPVALLSIGITGLIAALVQMVDWGKVWETASGLLADGLDFLADNFYAVAVAAGTFLAVQLVTHIGSILTAVKLLTVGLFKMGAAWVVAMGPVGWAIAGITALTVVVVSFRKEIANLLGFDLVGGIKAVLNGLIATFRNGLQVIVNVIFNFVNIIKKALAQTFNLMLEIVKVAEAVGSFGGIGVGGIDNLAKDFGKIEKLKTALSQELKLEKLPSMGEILMQDIIDPTEAPDYLGNAVDGISNALRTAADKLRTTAEDVDKKMKKAWDKIVKGVESHKLEMVQEADLLGRIGEDYYITKEKYDLLNQAREAGITLSAEQIKYIEDESIALGKQADALDKLNKKFEFAKSTTTSFFNDLDHALLQGKNMWEAFGDAVMNVLTKILDKMNEVGVDLLFGAMKSAGWFGTNASQVYSSPVGPTQTAGVGGFYGQALGGVWNKGVQKFATGGVVGSPTMFGTRSGLGLMGEAGPEAIMPLTRGANGELGVKAEGVGGSPVVVNVINNANAKATVNQRQTSQGTEIDVMIDQLVADKLGTLGSASNTAMNTWNNRQLIAR